MGMWNKFTTWFTGRNGIYKDQSKVDDAVAQLNAITSSNGKIE